jgi:hypothetical protein
MRGKNAAGILALSIVDASLSVPAGELTAAHIQTVKKRMQAILTKAGITTSIGGIDFSANEDENHAFDPHWQPQYWILALGDQVNASEREIRKRFPKTATVPRPVKIKEWDGNQAALGYALKNTFVRRVSYQREASKDGSKHACRNTRDRDLRAKHQCGLAIILDRAGLHARLHLGGCRVVRTLNGPRSE